MKKSLFISGLLLLALSLSSQVSEIKSGVKTFNISKIGTETKKFTDQSRSQADATPPVITLEAPLLANDSLVKSDTRTLIIKGTVIDEGGVFAVMVNGIEATVAADGRFMAEIPQAFGLNSVKIVATDVAMNNTLLQFSSERSTQAIGESSTLTDPLTNSPEELVSPYSISITQPSAPVIITAAPRYNLIACVNTTEPLIKLMIYRNNSLIKGYPGNQIIPKGDCSFQLDLPVELNLGLNDVRIDMFAENDTVSSSVTIEYSLYAARNHALLIGSEKYDDSGIKDLSEPVGDATELYKLLTTEYNFDKENVILLKNPTKADIIGTLHQLRSKINPEDNLLIFYAGHGVWDEGMGVGYWLPRDAEKENPANWIPNTDLTNYLGAIKTRHTLLIADACFSGGIFKTNRALSTTFAIEMLYQLNSRQAITSGLFNQEVPDKSVFFEYLIKNLRENTNEYLRAEVLFSKMEDAVINNSENMPRIGTIQNVGDEGGDFIFIRARK